MPDSHPAAHGFTAFTPDPNKYHDPETVFKNSHLGLIVGSGSTGLRGIVVPRSTQHGASRAMGKKVHIPGKVIIDPALDGRSELELDLSKLNKYEVEQAVQDGQGSDNVEFSLDVFKRLAAVIKDKEEVPATMSTKPTTERPELDFDLEGYVAINGQIDDEDTQYEAEPEQSPVKVKKAAAVQSIGKAFPPSPERPASKTVQPSKRVFKPKDLLASKMNTPTTQTAEAPDCRVLFEMSGFGTFEARYHKVVQSSDNLILALVFDTRHMGSMHFVPQASDQDLLVDVVDGQYVYKVKSVGMRISIDHLDICILLIEEVADK